MVELVLVKRINSLFKESQVPDVHQPTGCNLRKKEYKFSHNRHNQTYYLISYMFLTLYWLAWSRIWYLSSIDYPGLVVSNLQTESKEHKLFNAHYSRQQCKSVQPLVHLQLPRIFWKIWSHLDETTRSFSSYRPSSRPLRPWMLPLVNVTVVKRQGDQSLSKNRQAIS